ncbi:juvenile hormone esterase-like [Anticarsia gemmatalis]|uniref:juvenile hormone esterase-like n=1 Tax=Anticarsia gemmatalis TaxID=129554 RepID=UPI003F75B7C9
MATVTIEQGTLQGGKSKTENGFEYFEFMGVPYAKPPVGELRFKSPQPPEPWDGVRDATTSSPDNISCQMHFQSGKIIGSEDCLYLNVYTPEIPNANSKLKPVMVLAHGGGFVAGNGILKHETGPDYLIENDVILVTFNYRLGPLGFLNLGLPEAAGNMGLKDFVRTLQWVQSNIEKFGGDKDNVTVIGVSAGSAACEYLTVSPLAKGLFHKCILQSGSCLNNWAMNEQPQVMAAQLAEELGYTGQNDDLSAIHTYLLNAPAAALTGLAFKLIGKSKSKHLFFGFGPTKEHDFGNGDLFLKDYGYGLLKEGKFSEVPILKGYCSNEGVLANITKPHGVKELTETKSFVDCWSYKLDDSDIKSYNPQLVTAYVDNANADEEIEPAVKFYGDLSFISGICIGAKLQSKKVPVYLYRFCYDGNLNNFKAMFGLKTSGAGHCDEVGYLLRLAIVANKVPDEADLLMRKRLTKMWTNFAKTSNPTPEDCAELPTKWPVFTAESKQYLNIDKEITIEADYEPEKMSIFEQIYDKYESN